MTPERQRKIGAAIVRIRRNEPPYRKPSAPNTKHIEAGIYSTHGLPSQSASVGDHVLRTWDGVWYSRNFRETEPALATGTAWRSEAPS
jgi:hypothetical protein